MRNYIFFDYLMPLLYTMNVISFVLFAYDKHCALMGKRRIPEFLLWLAGVAMGAFGALCSMVIFNHKTRKKSFAIGVPVLPFLELAVCVVLLLTQPGYNII